MSATDVGPLIDAPAVEKTHELVLDAIARGATIETGGKPGEGSGYFYEPTVLSNVEDGSRLLREEIFGPVAPIVTFDTDVQAVAAANATEYGLAAYVFTQDIDRAFHVVGALDVGMIGLNQGTVSNAGAPFGGVKHSGFGREGGPEGLREYLQTTYVAVASNLG